MSVNQIKIVSFMLICIFFSLFIAVLYLDNKLYDSELTVANLREQISQLEKDSAAAKQRYAEAARQATQDMQKSLESSQKIMAIKVPKDCNLAIKWGITQAKAFRNA